MGVTGKILSTGDAGAYVASPACVARTWQLPVAIKTMFSEEIVHTSKVKDVSNTVNPEVLEALEATFFGLVFRTCEPGSAKVIV
jgi:hypothetical protein